MKQATEISEYVQQALDFAKKHNVKLSIGSPDYRYYFPDDRGARFVFPCKLSRKGKSYSFTFGQSIAEGDNEPTMYDILAAMTKYDPESFEWFCKNYGYDEDSRKAEKTYKAVVKEWHGVERLFSDCLDELREIA